MFQADPKPLQKTVAAVLEGHHTIFWHLHVRGWRCFLTASRLDVDFQEQTRKIVLLMFSNTRKIRGKSPLFATHGFLWRVQFSVPGCFEQGKLQGMGFTTTRYFLLVTTKLCNVNGLVLQQYLVAGVNTGFLRKVLLPRADTKRCYGTTFSQACQLPFQPDFIMLWALSAILNSGQTICESQASKLLYRMVGPVPWPTQSPDLSDVTSLSEVTHKIEYSSGYHRIILTSTQTFVKVL